MPDKEHALSAYALVVGCGYLGRALARRLQRDGVSVYGTTRDPRRAAELRGLGVEPLLLDLLDEATFEHLRPAQDSARLDVFYLIPPGWAVGVQAARRLVTEGLPRFIQALEGTSVGRAVMVSSSAVYGDRAGAAVDADTPAAPEGERGRLLLAAERVWLQSPLPSRVLRLAGIYGPGRVIGLQGIRAGGALSGDPRALLNLIHVEDAAELLLRMVRSRGAAPIELGCDGAPVARGDYYDWLAATIGLPAPERTTADGAGRTLGRRGSGSRRCDNALTCRRTGWSPRHRDFRSGLAGLVTGATGG